MRGTLLLLPALWASLGCAPPTCANATLPDCTGTVAPSFATLHATVLQPRCVVDNACHSVEEHQGDLVLEGEDVAYASFSRFVAPGDPICSVAAERLTTTNIIRRMPPAGGLSDADRCAILTWIEAGAER